MIEEILENFDFDKVHRVMKVLNWGWSVGGSLEESEVPSVRKLVIYAYQLLTAVTEEGEKTENKFYVIASGGFKATYDEGGLKLEFILEEWGVEND